MKRSFLIWIAPFLLLLFVPPPTLAADSRGGSSSSLFSLDFLAELQERDVVEKGEQLIGLKVKGDADSTRLLVRGGFRPIPLIELYGLIGGADLSIDDFNGFDAKMGLAYGGGVYLILYESPYHGALRLFLDYSYLQFTPKDRVEVSICQVEPCDAPGNSVSTVQDEKIRWREHVMKIGGVFPHDIFRPYGGLRVSFVRGKDNFSFVSASAPITDPNIEAVDLEEDDNIGVFGGIDIFLDPTEAVAFNLEASLFDVNSIRAGFRFAY